MPTRAGKNTNMKNETNGAGKEQRAVLNLNLTQAKELLNFISVKDGYTQETLRKIEKRLAKTITKHENSKEQYHDVIKATSCADCQSDIEHCTCGNQEVENEN